MGGVVELELHGKNTYRAKTGTYRLRLIHGYHGGTALRDMIRREYAGRVLRLETGVDPGVTDLVLREF